MDFRHLIVTCLFSKLRLPFDNQKVKENYAILIKKLMVFNLQLIGSIEAILVSNLTMRGNEICDMLNERIKNESRLF